MREPAADDGLLAGWLAHHAALMILIVAVATTASAIWGAFALPSTEVWSIVVDSEQKVPARQLGVVAEALFRAEDTYTEAMGQLGMTGDPAPLYAIARLRAVPESRLLIVTARTNDLYTASTTSDAMAQALVHAFERSGYQGLRVLGAPQAAPITSGLTVPVLALAGAVMGMLLALGTSIVLYRVRAPVLTMDRAAGILHPTRIASIPGRARVIGALRPHPPSLSPTATRIAGGIIGQGAWIDTPGMSEPQRQRLEATLAITIGEGEERRIVVADPRTSERDLRVAVAAGTPAELLWIS